MARNRWGAFSPLPRLAVARRNCCPRFRLANRTLGSHASLRRVRETPRPRRRAPTRHRRAADHARPTTAIRMRLLLSLRTRPSGILSGRRKRDLERRTNFGVRFGMNGEDLPELSRLLRKTPRRFDRFDPTGSPSARFKWIAEILRFPSDLTFLELHDADRIGRLPVVQDYVFGNP